MTGPPRAPDEVADWAVQADAELRFDWGPNGLRALGPHCAVIVVVDVLSFTTCVSVAVAAGAEVVPHRWHDGTEVEAARAAGALLAGRGPGDGGVWLSPSSLLHLRPGARVLLPSPNGSALARSAATDHSATVLAGCLRNATAVGRAAVALADDAPIGVVAAGERWRGATGPLRPAVEDLWGAGAVLRAAREASPDAVASPEAGAAIAARDALGDPATALAASASGRELVARGRAADVALSADVDRDGVAPVLVDGVFTGADREGPAGVGELAP